MKKLFSVLLTAALLCSAFVPAFASEAEPKQDAPSIEETSASMDAETLPAVERSAGEPMENGTPDGETEESAQSKQASEEGNVEESSQEPVEEAENVSDKESDVTLDVLVPDESRITINPYRMPVELNGATIREQIVCEENLIINRTASALNVNAEAFGTLTSGSEMILVSSPQELSDETKTLFVWFEFLPVAEVGALLEWSGIYTGAENQIVVNGGASNVLTLPDAGDDGMTYAAFRAFGYASLPDSEIWGKQDNANFRVSFTFTPVPEQSQKLSDDVESSDIAEAVENTESSEVAKPVEDVEPVEDAEPSDVAELVENAEPSDVTEPVEDAEPSDVAKPVNDAELSEDTTPLEGAEPSDDTQPIEDTEPSDDMEPVEDAEPSGDTQPVGDAEPSGDTQPVEDTESSNDTQPVEDTEPSNDTQAVEDTEPSDIAEPSDVAEPVENTGASEYTEPVGVASESFQD